MSIEKNDLIVPDLSGLSEEEAKQFLAVMKRAQEFEIVEEKHLMRQPLEGQLYKYTNVVKGWQHRWFVLNPDAGILEYFEKEEQKKLRPRGCLQLAGAMVCPSDEDSQTFAVNAVNGDMYRLKAFDAKERQHWVNRLRATAEFHTESLAVYSTNTYGRDATPTLVSTNQTSHSATVFTPSSTPDSLTTNTVRSQHRIQSTPTALNIPVITTNKSPTWPLPDSAHNIDMSIKDCIDSLTTVKKYHHELTAKIEALPPTGELINSLDKELLLLKATSSATWSCLEKCLTILQHQAVTSDTGTTAPSSGRTEWYDGIQISEVIEPLSSPCESYTSACDTVDDRQASDVCLHHCDELEDKDTYKDTDLGGMEEHKNIILHLLSQLKLGMDLTKVVLPTFILEKRSLLELFADCMAHPSAFLRIPDEPTPESRMISVLEWYLTSFHAGRQGSIAKKPYNPIIGEHFHCSWRDDTDVSQGSHIESSSNRLDGSASLYYCSEQVSHHPPISAFYFESPEKQMYMDASIWTRSKFMGMSIGVVMIGKVHLRLLSHEEEYEFSLPSAYARSILTVPWVELGDKVTLQCDTTGYTAAVIFHTKPFYGGRLHKVTAEVKHPGGETVCRVVGEWNGSFEFTYANGSSRIVDTSRLAVRRKCVRPLHLQANMESRKLWRHVTDNLQKGDIEKATEHKRYLEDRQRQSEKSRRDSRQPFPTKYFERVGDEWVFHKPLQRGQTTPSI